MKYPIIEKLEAALQQTISLLENTPESEFNTAPSEGSWSAAQLGEHLYLSEKDMAALLNTPAPAATRDPQQRGAEFEQILLNFERKLDAPPFLVPQEKEYSKEELVAKLKQLIKPVIASAQSSDLAQVPDLGDDHPLNGATKLELIHFAAYHTMRHNRQIEKVREQVG